MARADLIITVLIKNTEKGIAADPRSLSNAIKEFTVSSRFGDAD